jgi:hypothetical protein
MRLQPTKDKPNGMNDQSNNQQGGGEGSEHFIAGGGKDEVAQKTDEVDRHGYIEKSLA